MPSRRRPRPPLGLVVPAMLAAATALVPVAYLVDVALDQGLGFVVDELTRIETLHLVARSLWLTVCVTTACLVIAVPAAWLVARTDLHGRRWWRVVMALPLAVPSYLAAFAWISWQPQTAGFWGAFLVLTAVSSPFMFVPTVAAMSRLDPSLDEIAVLLGRGRAWRMMMMSARQVRSTVVAGGLLVALYVLSDFGAVATMRYDTFTWVIYGAYRAGFNPSRAAVLAGLLVVIALVLVVAERAIRGGEVATVTRRASRGGSRDARASHRLGRTGIAAQMFLVAVTTAALVVPLWRVVVWVTRGSGEVTSAEVIVSLWASLRYSLVAAAVTVVFALPVAILAVRHRSLLTSGLERSTYVAHALPGIVVAISMVFVGVRLVPGVYQRAPLLVFAYVALFLPLAVGAIRTAVEQVPRSLDEVATSLGATPIGIVRRVTVPLVAPGVGAAGVLVLLATMKELPVTMLLHPTGVDTLATRLWTHTAVSDYATAGPYALAMVLFVAVPTALTVRWQ